MVPWGACEAEVFESVWVVVEEEESCGTDDDTCRCPLS
jgi:hypothetical protein